MHDKLSDYASVVIYGQCSDVACSACAPIGMKAEDVALIVQTIIQPFSGSFQIVDIATVRPGPASPIRCNLYPDRQHWFLLNDQSYPISAKNS